MKFLANILAAVVVAMAVIGCGPDSAAQKKEPAAPKAQKQTSPLPAEALLKLDQLKPPVFFDPVKKTLTPSKEIQAECKKLFVRGRAFQARGKLDNAIDLYQRALMINPDDNAVLKQLGISCMSRGMLSKAIDYLQQAVAYEPDDLQLQVALGRAFLLSSRSQDAIYRFRCALKTKQADPAKVETAFAMLYLGRLLEKDGYYTASLECFDRLKVWMRDNWKSYEKDRVLKELVLKPERFMIARGRLLDKLDKPREALIEYQRAYSRDRSNVLVGKKYFGLLVKLGEYKKAEKLLVDFSHVDSYDAIVGKLAEELCEESGDKEMPMRIWRRYGAKDDICTGLAISLADAAAKMGNIEEAQKLLMLVLRETKDCPDAAARLAALKLKQGQGQDALAATVRIIKDNPSARESINAAVDVIAQSPNGKAMLDKLVADIDRKAAKDVCKMYVAAVMARKLDDLELFNSLLNDAVEADPKFAPAYIELLQSSWAIENIAKANSILKEMKTQIGGPVYYYLLGSVELERGQTRKALTNLEASRKADPENAQTLRKLSKAYKTQARKMPGSPYSKKMRQISEQLLIKAIEVQPGDPKAYRELFDDYLSGKNLKNAAVVAAKFIRNIPDDPEGKIMAADTYLLDGRRSKAGKLVESLLKSHPENPRVKLLDVRWQLSKYRGVLPKDVFDSAAGKLEKITAEKNCLDESLVMYSRLISRRVPGDYSKAAEVYKKLYDRNIHDFRRAVDYARALLRAKDYQAAEPVVKYLLNQSPSDYLIKRMYVEILTNTDRMAEAEKYLEREIARSNSIAKKLFAQKLLQLYVESGETDKALKVLDDMQSMRGVKKDYIQQEHVVLLCQAQRYEQALKYASQSDNKSLVPTVFMSLVESKDPKNLKIAGDFVAAKLKEAKTDEEKKLWQLQRLAVVAAEAREKKDSAAYKAAANVVIKEYPADYGVREYIFSTAMLFGMNDLAAEYADSWREELLNSEDFGEKEKKFVRWCRESLVRLSLSENKYQQAGNLLDQFLAEDGGTASFNYSRSLVYAEMGQPKRALEHMNQAYLMDKDNAGYMNDLAYQMAVVGVDLTKAEQLSRKAIQKEGFRQAFIDTLGWILYKQGKFSRAGEIISQIIPTPDEMRHAWKTDRWEALVKDSHPVMLDHAGDIFYRLGWNELAGKYWQGALDSARHEKHKDNETINTINSVKSKLKVLQSGKAVEVSPLGDGVDVDE